MTAPPLPRLQQHLASRQIGALILPRADAHHVEWLAPGQNAVERLTGFTGSFGVLVVTPRSAVLCTSDIYAQSEQASLAVRGVETARISYSDPVWIAAQSAGPGGALAYDPLRTSIALHARLEAAAHAAGARLLAWADWDDTPPASAVSSAPAQVHPLIYAGVASAEKRRAAGAAIAEAGADAALISAADAVCWLLNLRGGDAPDTPLLFAFCLLARDGSARLFARLTQIGPAIASHLGPDVRIEPYEALEGALQAGGHTALLMDPDTASVQFADAARRGGARLILRPDPCDRLKGCKNPIEIAGARAAHRRDGLAVCRFLAWLDARFAAGDPPGEREAAAHIEGLRAQDPLFRSVSFATIAAAGPNAAAPHYRPRPAGEDRRPQPGELFLLDSGGQYLDGTTDVTRTIAHGRLDDERRARFTLAMQALIDASTLPFPAGARGIQLDAAARARFWREGLDFGHGLGHGVGSYLGVHEGPSRMRPSLEFQAPLEAGMILSIEPGCYVPGAYGLRHENLALVVAHAPIGAAPALAFETLTLVPFDRAALALERLSRAERGWLDGYHQTVRTALAADLRGDEQRFLLRATEPLG